MNTTMGMHLHLTYGWEVLHDDPAQRFTLLRTPQGRFATVHGDDPALSVLIDGTWMEWPMPTTDHLRISEEDFGGPL